MHQFNSTTVKQKESDVQTYKINRTSEIIPGDELIGLDANVLVDFVESDDFRKDIQIEISIGTLSLFTTSVALGEARNVLIKKRSYSFQKATDSLLNILKEFNIKRIEHTLEGNSLAFEWFEMVKKSMYFKNIKTALNDFRIIANLYLNAKITVFMTEDQNLEKALGILGNPISVRIVGEASHLNHFEIKRFFKQQSKEKHKFYRKR